MLIAFHTDPASLLVFSYTCFIEGQRGLNFQEAHHLLLSLFLATAVLSGLCDKIHVPVLPIGREMVAADELFPEYPSRGLVTAELIPDL